MHKLDGIRSEAVTQNDSQNSKAFASAAYIAQSSAVSQLPSVQQTGVKRADKVIPLKNKYSEVIRLSGEGLQSTAIAQKLNMGKGEVELILGLRR